MKRSWILAPLGLFALGLSWVLLRPADLPPEPPERPMAAPPPVAPLTRAERPGRPSRGARVDRPAVPPPPRTSSATAPEVPEAAAPARDTGNPITVWPASPEGIQGAIREALPRMVPCYEDALRERPDLAGRLVTEVRIVGDDGLGRIDLLDIVDGTLDDEPLEGCMLDVLADLQFDPPAGDGVLTFRYPFVFAAR